MLWKKLISNCPLDFCFEGLPGVLWVLPDSYIDVKNKDYGGELFNFAFSFIYTILQKKD